MSLESLQAKLPPYAKDIALNLTAVAQETGLSETQKWGCILACAHALGVRALISEVEDGCPLTPDLADAARAAAAVMNMNNVYYRAIHVMKNREYATLPAKLRMSRVANPGARRMDFELWCLAVSAISGCSACLDSHEEVLRTHATPAPVVQAALRIAAILNAVSHILSAEAAGPSDKEGAPA